MRDYTSQPKRLAGQLLLAHPGMMDPNFARAVLYIATHEADEGSLGFIVNRPTGKTVGDLVPSPDAFGPLAALPVLWGGPVAADRLTLVSFRWVDGRTRVECRPDLSVEQARELAGDPQAMVRAFIGYAGWSAGQIERELSQNAWLVRPPCEDAFDFAGAADLWAKLMGEMGPWLRLLSGAPDDPSLN